MGEVVKPLHPKTGRCLLATVPPTLAARDYRDSGLVRRRVADAQPASLPLACRRPRSYSFDIKSKCGDISLLDGLKYHHAPGSPGTPRLSRFALRRIRQVKI